MAEVRVGINGFGRIGRCVLKQLQDRNGCRVVGVNDLADIGDLAYLLKHDSVHGWYPRKVRAEEGAIRVGDDRIPFFAERNPSKLPWGDVGADIVLECTGAFRTGDKAAAHLEGGAKRVIISAPAGEVDGTFVMGVNHDDYDPAKHKIVSNASCTTNSLAPVAKVLNDSFGIEHLMITTVHAYTSSQALMDTPVRKRRRGRAAAVSVVPTTTGAARATALVIPELEGRMDGMALRVPIPDGSVTDIVTTLKKPVTPELINETLEAAAADAKTRGVLRVTRRALVSRDIIGDHHSAVVDAESTMVLRDNVAKLLVWYDNEWGYASRLADFAELMVAAGV